MCRVCSSAERRKERKDVTMRKLCFVLTALLLTVPAMATIQITCAQVDDTNVVVVNYNAVADGNMPRAFGLDITVSAGVIASLVSHNGDFWVHPGNIVITDGNVTSEGSPVALVTDPCALGGIGTSGMTIEMGSLYADGDPDHNTPPANSGELLRFIVSTDCTVTVAGNPARGNVVNETTAEAVTNLPTDCNVVVTPPDCFPAGPQYDSWVARGKPSCWCNQYGSRQCHGDAAIDRQGTSKKGYYYVGSNDLNVLIDGWLVKEPPKGSGILGRVGAITGKPLECADLAHDRQGTSKKGYYYIGSNDLNVLIGSWLVKEPPKGSGVPTDCPVH